MIGDIIEYVKISRYEESELKGQSTIQKFRIVQKEGSCEMVIKPFNAAWIDS